MRHKNSRKTVTKKRRAGGRWHLPSFQYGQRYVCIFISIICAVSLFVCSYYFYKDWKADEVDVYFIATGMIDIPTEEEILAMMAEIRENPQEFRFVA